ncbi:hypothetical protein V8C26DRAFT_383185 [Trichoderma gracile]
MRWPLVPRPEAANRMMACPRHLILDQSGHSRKHPHRKSSYVKAGSRAGGRHFPGSPHTVEASVALSFALILGPLTAGSTGQSWKSAPCRSPSPSCQFSANCFKSQWHIRLIGRGGVTLHRNLGWVRGSQIPVRESAASSHSMQAAWRPLSCRCPAHDPLGRYRQLAISVHIHNTALPFQMQDCRLLVTDVTASMIWRLGIKRKPANANRLLRSSFNTTTSA